MAFFGLTHYAGRDTNSVFRQQKARQLNFHAIPDERFDEVWSKYCMAGTQFERTMSDVGHDPGQVMQRSQLVKILAELTESEPDTDTIDAFFTFFNTDASGIIHYDEYRKSIENLKLRSANVGSSSAYTSHAQMQEDRARHKKLTTEFQHCQDKPMTTTQEVGWGAHKPITGPANKAANLGETFHGHRPTDVTLGEGRNVMDDFM
mmetsp:Transcript_1064/g.1242  ORF Transcript_1064/g.1242 Transcript_1064/m.1242 type:complete len:205 (+) Transcript_1064:124-738(+)|eukprot:CAMPEP_0197845742 /NCGR_PEP_ID=MMETSP1438-20131217/2633_1 /TAXON_ID=1461541 /ORGANISM="Pterosperma sp., Strain CCMP1384" /LENGTH=204 /DNA_ID=CAMNT_0043457153 /DNA_START=111 /DNA_END=725 /DNA_ORIENTATION=+